MARIWIFALLAGSLILGGAGFARQADTFESVEQTRAALERAKNQAAAADARGKKLEAAARSATKQAEKTAREGAALAARIQQAEAGIAAGDARIALINAQSEQLKQRLARRREPLVRLTAALQKLARRPLILSALRPGSLRETVYLRAMLDTAVPQVRSRTAALRAEIDRGQQLENETRQALGALRASEQELTQRQTRLAAIETQQRLIMRRTSGNANREVERALALAEEARDLDTLIVRLHAAGSLREELAALPGPIMRPARPDLSQIIAATIPDPAAEPANLAKTPRLFQLPVNGRTIAGFAVPLEGGLPSNGISLAPRPGAQVIAPASGRVAFAGPYRGYDRIVILDHPDGWTSLVTGLARIDVDVGEDIIDGGPLGVAGGSRPVINLELRRSGVPVNPIDYLR